MATTLNVGWEANPLNNNGVSFYIYTNRLITITGFQISVSMATNNSNSVGICEVLACCSIGAPGATLAFGGLSSYPGFAPTQLNPDFGASALNNPAGVGVAGFVGYTGYLFSTILKTVTAQAINQCIARDDLKLVLPPRSCLVFHMDHAGSSSADCEMQGVVNYT